MSARDKSPGNQQGQGSRRHQTVVMFSPLKDMLNSIGCDDFKIDHYKSVLEVVEKCNAVRYEKMATSAEIFVKLPVIQNSLSVYRDISVYTKLSGTDTEQYFIGRGVEEREKAIDRHKKNKNIKTTTFEQNVIRAVLVTSGTQRAIKTVPHYCNEQELESPDKSVVAIKVGTEKTSLYLGEYKLLIALASLVGQSESVLEDLISLCLTIFRDREYHIPASHLIGWGDFDAIGMTAAASLYYRNSGIDDLELARSVTVTLKYVVYTIILSIVTVFFSVYAPALPEKLIESYTLNYTFGIITSTSAFILVIACIMYKCILPIVIDNDSMDRHGYIHDMLVDIIFGFENTVDDTDNERLIQFILDEVFNVQRKDWWLAQPDTKLSENICQGLDTMPSIITPHTRGDRRHAEPGLQRMALVFSMAACITVIETLPIAVYSNCPCAGLFVVVYMLWTKTDIAKFKALLVLVPNLCILAWPHGRTPVRGETCWWWHFTVVCLLCVAHSQAGLLLWRLAKCGSLAHSNSACLVVLWLVLAVSTLVNRHTMQDFGLTLLVYFIHQEYYYKRPDTVYDEYLQKLVTEHREPQQSTADAEKSR